MIVRRSPIEFPSMCLRPGDKLEVRLEHTKRFRLGRLAIPREVGDRVLVHDIRVGEWSLAEATDGAGPWSGVLFSDAQPSDGPKPRLTAPPDTHVRLVLSNTTDEDVTFTGRVYAEVA